MDFRSQGEAYCYVHRQGRRAGRRAGIVDGVALGLVVGLVLGFCWRPALWGPFQYTRGEMYRGGGMAVVEMK